MAEDITTLGVDASEFESGFKRITEIIKQYNLVVDDAADISVKLNRQNELVSASFKTVEADGTKVVKTFGQIKNSVISVTDGMGGLIKRFRDLEGNLTNLPTSFGLKTETINATPEGDEVKRIQAILTQKEREQKERARIYKVMKADQDAFLANQETKAIKEIKNEQNRIQAVLGAREAERAQKAKIYQQMRRDEEQNLRSQVEQTNKELQLQQKKSPAGASLGGGLASIGNRATSILLSQAILATSSALQTSVGQANDFAKELAAIGTLSQNSSTSLKDFEQGILAVSSAYGLARKDVATGVYETISNQIAEGSAAITFQAKAAKLAQATLSSQADAVNALSSVLNSYGKSVSETDQISGSLFKTIDLGRIRLTNIANTLGTVTVAAAQLGVSYEEVFAGLSVQTRAGVTEANALTFLRNLFNQLIKPTEAFSEVLKKNGFSSGQAAIQTLKLEGVLKLIAKEADGNIEKFGDLATNIRSLQAAISLAGDGGTKFSKDLREISGSINEFENATKISADVGKRFDVLTTTLSNEFLKVGQAIREGILTLTDAVGGADSLVKNLTIVIKSSFDAIIGSAAGFALYFSRDFLLIVRTTIFAIQKEFLVLRGLSIGQALTQLFTLPVGLGVAAGAVGAAIGVLSFKVQQLKQDTQDANQAILEIETETANIVGRVNAKVLADLTATQEKSVQIVSAAIAQLIAKYNELADVAAETFNRERDRTKALFDEIVSSQNKSIRDLVNQNNKAQNDIDVGIKTTEQLRIKLREEAFEISQKDSTLQLETLSRVQRREELLAEARFQAAAGNREASNTALEAANKQNSKLSELRDKIKQYATEYKSFIENTAKETFQNQSRIVDLTTNQINKSIDRLKKALKDVTDKTGDRTGISGRFLKGFVSELNIAAARTDSAAVRLRRNLERLQGRGRAAIVDDKTRELINSLDTNTVKDLRFRIRVGDSEGVSRILDEVKRQQEEQAEFTKRQIATRQASFLLEQAESARKNNDFDAERKFLQEAKELRLQSIEDPLQLQREFARFNDLIKESYKDTLTVVGKKKEEEKTMFDIALRNLDAQNDTNSILETQIELQKTLQKVETEKITNRNKELEVLRTNLVEFQTAVKQLNDIKIDSKTTPEQAAKLFEERAKQLDETIRTVANSPNDIIAAETTKARIKEQLTRESAAVQFALEIENNKKALAETQRNEVLKKDIRLKLLQATQDESKAISDNLATLKSRIGTNNQQVGDVASALELEIKLKDTRALIRSIRESLEAGTNTLTPDLEEKLRTTFETISVAGLTDEIRASLDFTEIFENDKEEVEKLSLKLKDLGADIERPKSFNLVITDAAANLDILIEKKRELEKPVPINLINPITGEETKGFANGGLVGGRAGNDANLARLTKGEFVINARSTKNNLSDLIAINSGTKTTTRNNNVNLNGISINLNSSGDAKVDARQIGDELSRLVKQGVLKLT